MNQLNLIEIWRNLGLGEQMSFKKSFTIWWRWDQYPRLLTAVLQPPRGTASERWPPFKTPLFRGCIGSIGPMLWNSDSVVSCFVHIGDRSASLQTQNTKNQAAGISQQRLTIGSSAQNPSAPAAVFCFNLAQSTSPESDATQEIETQSICRNNIISNKHRSLHFIQNDHLHQCCKQW